VFGAALGPPSAQSLFARIGCYPQRGGVLHHLEGRYPFFVAHTGSCARPNSSHRLQLLALYDGSLQVVAQSLLQVGRSRRYPPRIFPWMPGPVPRWSCEVHSPVSSLTASAFPEKRERVGNHNDLLSDFRAGVYFVGVVIPIVQASKFASHPGRSYPCSQ